MITDTAIPRVETMPEQTYLTWLKNNFSVSTTTPDSYDLTSSGVMPPIALLVDQIRALGTEFKSYLETFAPWGEPLLLDSISQIYHYPADRIVITSGVSSALYLLSLALLKPGDECLVEQPGYEPFVLAPELVGARVIPLPRRPEADYAVDLEELERLITPRTRMILLSNLHNPGMTDLTDEQIRDLFQRARRRNPDVRLVIDEIFHDFIRDEQGTAAALDDGIVALNGLGKVYGMGAIHVGWMLASPDLVARIRQLQEIVEGQGSTHVTEVLAGLVLQHHADYDAHWRRLLIPNHRIAEAFLTPLVDSGVLSGRVSEHGTVIFPKVNGAADADAVDRLVRDLAERQKVFVTAGRYFYGPLHIRIGIGGDSQRLEAGLVRLTDGLRAFANAAQSR
ncbi:MAG TPA: pyridoxal phosphate-dependent aminotransferase [Aggregatilineales bacterium]|nr:pyridoxal phosphate-dependent aminotransferase [Aggregatilineales bacterium]